MTPAEPQSRGLDAFEQLAAERRTSLRVDRSRPVPAQLVERLCRIACQAPNHKRTFPWRFCLFVGEGRSRLGEVAAEGALAAGVEERRAATIAAKYLRSPAVLLAGSAGDENPTIAAENRDAVAAGVQNLLLAATAAGLASHWSTGATAADPGVKKLAGLAEDDTLVAIIYLGWPTGSPEGWQRPAPELLVVDG